MFNLGERKPITVQEVERVLDLIETYDLDAANFLRSYIRGLEGLALEGELIKDEAGNN